MMRIQVQVVMFLVIIMRHKRVITKIYRGESCVNKEHESC
jgi:hypothetical protein